MVEHEQFRFRFRCQLGQLFRGGVEVRDVLPPIFLALVVAELRVNFVHQHVAAVAVFDDARARRAIAGKHDDFVGRLEPVAVGLAPGAVVHEESFHGYVLVLVDNTRLDLVRVHFVAGPVAVLQAVRANVDVFAVSHQDVIGHGFEPGGTKNFERLFPPEHPRTEDEVRVAERVIGMQVSDESSLELGNCETGHALSERGGSAADDAGTAIDNVRSVIDDDGDRWTRAIRVGGRIPRAEQHDLGARRRSGWRRCRRLRQTPGARQREQQHRREREPARKYLVPRFHNCAFRFRLRAHICIGYTLEVEPTPNA